MKNIIWVVIAAMALLLVAESAGAIPLKETHQETIADCSGSVEWHFVHNQTDATQGVITVGNQQVSNGPPFSSNVLHYWVVTSSNQLPPNVHDNVPDGKLVLSHYTCLGSSTTTTEATSSTTTTGATGTTTTVTSTTSSQPESTTTSGPTTTRPQESTTTSTTTAIGTTTTTSSATTSSAPTTTVQSIPSTKPSVPWQNSSITLPPVTLPSVPPTTPIDELPNTGLAQPMLAMLAAVLFAGGVGIVRYMRGARREI